MTASAWVYTCAGHPRYRVGDGGDDDLHDLHAGHERIVYELEELLPLVACNVDDEADHLEAHARAPVERLHVARHLRRDKVGDEALASVACLECNVEVASTDAQTMFWLSTE